MKQKKNDWVAVLSYPAIRLKLVDNSTYVAFKQWDRQPGRIKDWPCTLQEWKIKFPKRFEAAAWKNNRLVGLSLGKPT